MSPAYLKKKLKEALAVLDRSLYFREFSLPDFLIIGSQKCGTTALYSYLVQHPGIIAANSKEIHYFGNPYTRMKGTRWYASHFCTKSYKTNLSKKLGYMPLTGEATPDMHMPCMPKFVHELLPSAKLIALFRDPAERAFSQYHHRLRHQEETLSFEEAIAKSPVSIPSEQMNDEWAYHNNNLRSYITRGLYAEQLERWYQYYSKDRIHIIDSKDFFEDPAAELQKVLRFLEMPEYDFKIIGAIHAGDYKAEMSGEIREYLTSVFRPHNRRLFELIGRDFEWPS